MEIKEIIHKHIIHHGMLSALVANEVLEQKEKYEQCELIKQVIIEISEETGIVYPTKLVKNNFEKNLQESLTYRNLPSALAHRLLVADVELLLFKIAQKQDLQLNQTER